MILKVNGKKVDFFNGFQLDTKYDAVASTFSFVAYFNPDNPDHKELFRPGQYARCTVEHNDELILTGTLLSVTFNSGPLKQLAAIGGYSLPGVLEDCEIPTSAYPLQSDGLSLRQIASKFLAPFNITMMVDDAVSAAMSSVFETSLAKESQSVKAYLTELAAQKNITISHNAAGELVFTTAKTKQEPILDFTNQSTDRRQVFVAGQTINTGMSLSFNGQSLHKSIAVIKQASDTDNAAEASVRNPYVPIFRSKVMQQSSGTDNTTSQAARNALGEELANIKLTITTDRWEVDGKLLKPNNIVTVTNPELFLYRKTRWFIESINFTGDNVQTIATLNCVLPEVYNGETPKNIFADA